MFSDKDLDKLKNVISNTEYPEDLKSVEQAGQILKNGLVRENLRFLLACRKLQVDDRSVIDEAISQLLVGGVTMAYHDGITLENILTVIAGLYAQLSLTQPLAETVSEIEGLNKTKH